MQRAVFLFNVHGIIFVRFLLIKSMDMKSLSKLCIVFSLALYGLNAAKAQQSLGDDQARKTAEVQQFVNNANYTFVLNVNNPEKPMGVSLHPGYRVKVSKDSVMAFLPSTGTTSAVLVDTLNNIRFTWTNFNYNTAKTNGGWNIVIKPGSDSNIPIKQLTLYITTLGHATLKLYGGSRSPRTYDGYLKQGSLQLNAGIDN
jgi:hypothetical protein